jgi:hypothetical protein
MLAKAENGHANILKLFILAIIATYNNRSLKKILRKNGSLKKR